MHRCVCIAVNSYYSWSAAHLFCNLLSEEMFKTSGPALGYQNSFAIMLDRNKVILKVQPRDGKVIGNLVYLSLNGWRGPLFSYCRHRAHLLLVCSGYQICFISETERFITFGEPFITILIYIQENCILE